MARMRTLKPEFFRDKKIGKLGPIPALVYQALWVMADDGGAAPADPERVWGEMFVGWPEMTLTTVAGALRELAVSARIKLYRVGDDTYALIPRFPEHQKPSRPSKFRYPRSEEWVTPNTHGALTEHSVSTHAPVISYQVSGSTTSPAPKAPAGGWTSEAVRLYQVHVKGRVTPGRITGRLKPLVAVHGPDLVLRKWGEYCRVGRHFGLDGRGWRDPPLGVTAMTPERFVDTFDEWGKTEEDRAA